MQRSHQLVTRLSALAMTLLLTACSEDRDRAEGNPGHITADDRPNFLLIVTDDQSAVHTGKAGYPAVQTPNFDRLANEGIYFRNAYASAPTCTASRSALLAGQEIWRLQSSALLWGAWSDTMLSYQTILKEHGYRTGFTGKPWGPGYAPPAEYLGRNYSALTREMPATYSSEDYAANFAAFLDGVKTGQPFSFWMGIREPHRPLRNDDSSRFASLQREDYLPDHLPEIADVQRHLQGYLEEIEQLDRDIGASVQLLRERGLLDNTIVVVTSDNGMPFARAKMNNYLLGVQVPLLVYWPRGMRTSNEVEQVVSLSDFAPTFLSAAGIDVPDQMTGISLLPLIRGEPGNWERQEVYAGFERHNDNARPDGATHSRRSLHQRDWLYIRNHFPSRWPLGTPPYPIDAYPSNLVDAATGKPLQPYWDYSVNKRPREELYYLPEDPYQLNNLAAAPEHRDKLHELATKMDAYLSSTGDPVHATGKDVFRNYKYWRPADG